MSETRLSAAPPAQGELPESPYKGLVPYTEEDAAFFFGRDQDQEIIISNLLVWRLTLFYGASGVGKSSVLGAGVVPELRRRAEQNLDREAAPGLAVVYFNLWRNNALAGLVEAVEDAVRRAWGGRNFGPLPPGLPLVQVLQAWTQRLEGELLIILDQFEEFFQYQGQEQGGKDSFAYQFSQVIKEAGLSVNFLVAIREDALAKLDRFQGLIPGLFDNLLRLEHLDLEAAHHAVSEPLVEYNRRLPPGQTPVAIEPQLEEAVLEQVKTGRVSLGEAGRATTEAVGQETSIETPYLQLVLTRLWEEEQAAHSALLRLATLERLGGAEQIVRTHVDKVMSSLQAEEQEAAARMFRHFVTGGGAKFAQSVPDLVELTELPKERLQPILEKLSASGVRILRPFAPPAQPDRPNYEIFHDVLATAILDWRRRFTEKQNLEKQARRIQQEQAEEQQHRQQKELDRRRKRNIFGLVCFTGLALILALVAFLQSIQATAEKGRADDERKTAIQAQATAQAETYVRATAQANADANNIQSQLQYQKAEEQRQRSQSLLLAFQSRGSSASQLDVSLLLSLESIRVKDSPEGRNSLLDGLNSNPNLAGFLHGHTDTINAVAISPDGNLIASGGADRTVRLWEASSLQQVGLLSGHGYPVVVLGFSSDGKTLFSADSRGVVRGWDVVSQKDLNLPTTAPGPADSPLLALSPDGNLIATSSQIQPWAVTLWDNTTSKPASLSSPPVTVSSLVFSPDNKLLAIGYAGGLVRLWDVATRTELGSSLKLPLSTVSSLAFSPDILTLVAGGADGAVVFLDVSPLTLRESTSPPAHKGAVRSLAFAADGKTLASGGSDGSIVRWNPATRQPAGLALNQHQGAVNSLVFNQDGQKLISAGDDRRVIVWDLAATSGTIRRLSGSNAEIYSLAIRPDSKTVATGSFDGTIILWDVARGQTIASVKPGQTGNILSLAFSPDGKYLAAGTGLGPILILDATTGQPAGESLKGHTGYVYTLAFSPDGKTLASGSGDDFLNGKRDFSARLWDFATRRQIGANLLDGSNPVAGLAFSPDGTTLALNNFRTIALYNLADRRLKTSLTGSKGFIYTLAFSPDGKYLAAGGGDNANDTFFQLWDLESSQVAQTFQGHSGTVRSVSFSPDNTTIASASFDNTVRLWNVATGQPIGSAFTYHTNRVRVVAFSPDGNMLASAGLDKILVLLNTSQADRQQRACRIANRNLSQSEWQNYFGNEGYQQTCPGKYQPPAIAPRPTPTSRPPGPTPAVTVPGVTPTVVANSPVPAAPTSTARPVQAAVNLSVPYLHQISMVPIEFDGNWATGAASAIMIAAYYSRLTPRPNDVFNNIPSPYGWYISNEFASNQGGYVFNRKQRDPQGKEVAGVYGAVTDGGVVFAYRVVDFFKKLGLNATFRENVTQDQLKQYLNRGRPVYLSTNIKGFGHVVVVKGYTEDGRWIVNDSFWGKAPGGEVIYSWAEFGGTPWMITLEDDVTVGAAPTPTPTPTPPVVAVSLSPYLLAGAYKRDDGTLYGRPAVALYGQGSNYNQGSISFNLNQIKSDKKVVLRLVGLDDERTAHCQLQVVVNGQIVFDGADTFPNVPTNDNGISGADRLWGTMNITISGSMLTTGQNTLTLRNLTPWAGSLGSPYLLINSLEFTEE